MIGTRGLDQLALGAGSLLIARRTGTLDFAPFATVFILYSLTSQVGDAGLAFGVLRTPSTSRVALGARIWRIQLNVVGAVLGLLVGFVLGGAAGTVIAIGGLTLMTGPAVHVGRAALQWSGNTRRLSVGEGLGAFSFLAATVVFVHDAEDLLLFGVICVGKQLVELAVQGLHHGVFAADGTPVRASGIFASQVVTYLAANVDYLIVGAVLGAEALSVYAIGFRLASAFSSVVAAPLTRTAFVDFANAKEAQQQMDRLLKRIVVFGAVGVAVTMVAALLLPVILGPEWLETRRVTALLGLALPWRLLLGPVVALGLVNGSARRVVTWEIVRVVGLVAAIVAGSDSIDQVAGAVSAATILTIGWAYRRATTEASIATSRLFEIAGLAVAASVVALVLV